MSGRLFKPNPESKPGEPWNSRHGPIRKIDFNELDEFVDLYGAYGCIVVLTSDGQLGTMTHIGTEVDSIVPFVESLNLELKDHKEKSVVILSGGSGLPASKQLYRQLVSELTKNNYKIVNEFIEHRSKAPIPRIATLYKDKVVVKQFQGSEEKVTELSFTSPNNKTTYTQARELPLTLTKKNNFSGRRVFILLRLMYKYAKQSCLEAIRMKNTVKILSALTFAAFSVCSYSEGTSSAPATDATTSLLQQTISAVMDKYQIPGVAVELVVDGKPYVYYAGYADREKKDPISEKTIFEIGSISKVMTSILLAQEVDWAKMSLSDPVTKYVKDLPEAWSEVKLQDLATHISGLPTNPPSYITSREDMKQYLLGLKPASEDTWVYSNVGMGVLGYALEASTEKEFDKLYYRHIMNPLGMVSGVTIPPKLVKYYAQGYDKTGNPTAHMSESMLPAATSIKASARDMQKFLNAAIGLPGTPPRVFYPMRMTQSVYVKVGNDFQGLGWQIHPIISNDVSALSKVTSAVDFGPADIDEVYDRPTFDGDALIDKTGTTSGFRAYIAVLPNKKSGIVILANKNVPNSAIVAPAREILFKLTKLKG